MPCSRGNAAIWPSRTCRSMPMRCKAVSGDMVTVAGKRQHPAMQGRAAVAGVIDAIAAVIEAKCRNKKLREKASSAHHASVNN